MIRDCLSWAALTGEFSDPVNLGPLATIFFSYHDIPRLTLLCSIHSHTVFDDTFTLELAVSAYYSQISHFTIDV